MSRAHVQTVKRLFTPFVAHRGTKAMSELGLKHQQMRVEGKNHGVAASIHVAKFNNSKCNVIVFVRIALGSLCCKDLHALDILNCAEQSVHDKAVQC